jgi:hypothetical protein
MEGTTIFQVLASTPLKLTMLLYTHVYTNVNTI